MAMNDERTGVHLLSAALLGIQGVFWILLLLYLTSIQLEMIYPYITMTTLAEIGIVPAYNIGIACWSVGMAVKEHMIQNTPDLDSRRFSSMLRVHAVACLPCIPFGPIIGTWCYVTTKGSTMDETKVKKAILTSILGMLYVTSGAIAAFLLVAPSILVHQYQDLIYPYSMVVTNPVFAIFGAYCLTLVAGDVFFSIACIIRKFTPFSEETGTTRFAKLLRAWAMMHVIAIPVGPFLAVFYDTAAGTRKDAYQDRKKNSCNSN
jgi:hypothetical protein